MEGVTYSLYPSFCQTKQVCFYFNVSDEDGIPRRPGCTPFTQLLEGNGTFVVRSSWTVGTEMQSVVWKIFRVDVHSDGHGLLSETRENLTVAICCG